jgi:lysophospholipase L1-like esterase
MPVTRENLRPLVFALIPTLLVLGSIEIAARIYESWHPPHAIDFDAGFSSSARAFIPLSPGSNTMHTNPEKSGIVVDQTFSLRKPAGTFRIAALGESSVNYLQANFQKLAEVLKSELHFRRVEIINAGARSYGSQRLEIMARELLAYQPDLLFLYMGHNEFEEVEQFHLSQAALAPALSVFYRLASVRVATSMFFGARLKQLEREHAERLASTQPDVARAWTTKFTQADVAERMNFFHENLNSIVDAYQKQGIPVLMSTIPSNLIHPYLPREGMEEYDLVYRELYRNNFDKAHDLGRQILRKTAGRHQSSDLENGILRDVAAKHGIQLVDVEAAVSEAEPHHIPGETLFTDHCHLNEKGNAVLIAELHKAILARVAEWEKIRSTEESSGASK